jgi:hypothetical protein
MDIPIGYGPSPCHSSGGLLNSPEKELRKNAYYCKIPISTKKKASFLTITVCFFEADVNRKKFQGALIL